MIILEILDFNPPEDYIHLSTDWQVSKYEDFSEMEYESIGDEIGLLTHIYNGVSPADEDLYIRARVLFENKGYTDYSNIRIHDIKDIEQLVTNQNMPRAITQPTVGMLGDINSQPFSNITLYTSPFHCHDEKITHKSTSWAIEDLNGYVMYASPDDEGDLLEIEVNVTLDKNKSYVAIVAHRGSNNDVSIFTRLTFKTGN